MGARRAEPLKRAQLRYADPGQPDEFDPETQYNAPPQDDKAYQNFRKAGSKRSGTFTATQTGAKEMARQREVGRIKGLLSGLQKEERIRKRRAASRVI